MIVFKTIENSQLLAIFGEITFYLYDNVNIVGAQYVIMLITLSLQDVMPNIQLAK